MKQWQFGQSNRKSLATWFGITIGLAGLCLVALLWGLRGAPPVVYADPGTLYVDGATGEDTVTCGTTMAPCRTISYTLNSRASDGDIIQVAQGAYTENLSINVNVTLEGGYESIDWTRSVAQYETIIDGSSNRMVAGDWDGSRVMKPTVISDGAEYMMWFDGTNLLGEVQVGLATSSDGISWTRYLTNPVLTGSAGAWDEYGEEHAPSVLKEDSVYKMWYEGSDGGVRQLGYATSTNGIDWTKYPGNPVLTAGPGGYDEDNVAHGSVMNDGGTYKLWYHAIGDQGGVIAYATSPDGVDWTKQGPVLRPESGNWDEFGLWGPSVLKLDGTYWMWYSGAGTQSPAIGVVTSTDGISWTRFLAAPVVTETADIGDPCVISDGGKLKMWYQDFEQGDINYAESDDGISWTKSPSNPVLMPGTLAAQWGEHVVSFEDGSDGAALDGFTVTGGDAESGGGVLIANGGSATIANAVITGNRALIWGGGAWVSNADATIRDSVIAGNHTTLLGGTGIEVNSDLGPAHLTLESCTLSDNAGGEDGGGLHVGGASAELRDVTLIGNVAGGAGGGIAVEGGSTATIRGSHVISNTANRFGGGIAVWNGSWAIITGTQIYANTAVNGEGGGIGAEENGNLILSGSWVVGNASPDNQGGGIIAGSGSSYVDNSVIAGNFAGPSAGGFWLTSDGSHRIVNCHIVGNQTDGEGAAIATAYAARIEVTNTLILSNTGETGIDDRDGSGSVFELNYCDTYGNSPDGTDGVTINRSNCLGMPPADGLDPLLAGGALPGGVGPAFATQWMSCDYHLEAGSSAIDAGTPAGAPATDIEGTPRDVAPDMGAYEWVFRVWLPRILRSS